MIAICPNPYRDKDCALSLKAAGMLRDAGFEICICPVFADENEDVIPQGLDIRRIEDIASECSMMIVIGGDGTILSATRRLKNNQVPILGINLGTKGFMTALEPEELDYIVEAVKGNYKISRRMKLSVYLYRNGELIYSDCALNDAVIHGYGDCINMDVICNGDRIRNISGDGIILSTPTGSTGYSMSAGGPIVEPDAENIIISPICAHAMGSRSFVLGPDREVSVQVEKLHDRRAYLSVDGNSVIDLANQQIIFVKRSESSALMVNMQLRSFYEIAYKKLV